MPLQYPVARGDTGSTIVDISHNHVLPSEGPFARFAAKKAESAPPADPVQSSSRGPSNDQAEDQDQAAAAVRHDVPSIQTSNLNFSYPGIGAAMDLTSALEVSPD
jgi:hypothetical protein